MLNTPDNSPRPRGKKSDGKPNKIGSSSDVNSDSGSIGGSSNSGCPSPCKDKTALIGTKSGMGGNAGGGGGGFMTLGHKSKTLKQMLNWGKANLMARGKPGYLLYIFTVPCLIRRNND